MKFIQTLFLATVYKVCWPVMTCDLRKNNFSYSQNRFHMLGIKFTQVFTLWIYLVLPVWLLTSGDLKWPLHKQYGFILTGCFRFSFQNTNYSAMVHCRDQTVAMEEGDWEWIKLIKPRLYLEWPFLFLNLLEVACFVY